MGELTLGGRAEAFARAPETIGRILEDARTLEVDHVILSGDLTAYALPVEFDGARKALGAWADEPRRCTVIPGNHDRYTPGAHRTRRFEQTFGNLLVSDLPDVAVEDGFPFVRLLGEHDAVIGLQSARVPYFPGLSYGIVGRRQRDALAALVHRRELQGRAVLVVVHHAPLGARGKPDRLLHGLVDAPALLASAARRPLRRAPRPHPQALPLSRHRPAAPHLRRGVVHPGRPRGVLAHRDGRRPHRTLGEAQHRQLRLRRLGGPPEGRRAPPRSPEPPAPPGIRRWLRRG